MSGELAFSLWFVPAKPYFQVFEKNIKTLANTFGALPFQPHVTGFSGTAHNREAAVAIVQKAISQFKLRPFILNALDLGHSEQFFQTFYIRFGANPVVGQVCRFFWNATGRDSNFRLNPHLSLLYHPLSPDKRRDLMRNFSMPLSTVPINAIWLVATGATAKGGQDHRRWEVFFRGSLEDLNELWTFSGQP